MSRSMWCLLALAALTVGCQNSTPAPSTPVATGDTDDAGTLTGDPADTGDADAPLATDDAGDEDAVGEDDEFGEDGAVDEDDGGTVDDEAVEDEDETDDEEEMDDEDEDEAGDEDAEDDADDEGDEADDEDDAAAADDGGTEVTADTLFDQALEAAQQRDIAQAIEHLRAAVKLDGEHREARLYLAYSLQQEAGGALEKAEDDEAKDAAYALLREAGEHAAYLARGDAELDDREKRVLPDILCDAARGEAHAGETEKALALVTQALKLGFADFGKLESDEDLAAIREQPEFASLVDEYKAQAMQRAQEHARELLAENEPFDFDFTLPGLDDKPIKLADYQGQVVIVDIWGTWCPPCRMEVPHFIALRDKYHEQGLEVIGLNYEDTKADIEEFVAQVPINYPLALGDEPTKNMVPDFEGFPTTLFLDRTGTVRLKVVGYHEYIDLEGIVLTLLSEAAPEGSEDDAAEDDAAAEESTEDAVDEAAEEDADADAAVDEDTAEEEAAAE
jgi:thiol-disulfide isomerase/thioredoxin